MITEMQNRMRAHREELSVRIANALPQDGTREIQPGVHLRRHSQPTEPVYAVAPPSFCVIAQGSKNLLVGDMRFRYDAAHYLITTADLPVSGAVVEASAERPFLSFRLVLDSAVITSMMVEAGGVQHGGDSNVKAVDVSALDAELLDATLRLVRLAETPNEYRVLAPLVTRGIVYRLLVGAQGRRLQFLAKFGGHAHRMVRAIETIRANFTKPLRIVDIAKLLHMSVSGFHAHFKAVTAMSPLQLEAVAVAGSAASHAL